MYCMGKPVGCDGKLKDGYIELDKSQIIVEVEEYSLQLFRVKMFKMLDQWMIWSILFTLYVSLEIREGQSVEKSTFLFFLIFFMAILFVFELVKIYSGEYQKKHAQTLGAIAGFLDGLAIIFLYADKLLLLQSKAVKEIFFLFLVNITVSYLLFTLYQIIDKQIVKIRLRKGEKI